MLKKDSTINTNLKILVIGQVPPPMHGSNYMTKVFLEALEELHYSYKLVNKKFSNTINEVGILSPIKGIRFLKVYYEFIKNVLTFKPSLLVYFIATTPLGLIPDCIILSTAILFRIPIVLYIHGRGHRDNYSHPIYTFIYRIILNKAKAVMILSSLLKDDINFMPSDIYVLPNCLHTDDHCQIEAASSYKKSEGHLQIIFVGNLLEAKGVFTLVQAVPLVLEKNPHVRFSFIGSWRDPLFKGKVNQFIAENKIEKAIEFLGPKYGEEKIRVMEESDVFVFSTHYPIENFPVVIIEALACSLPVISTKIGGIPEMLDNGDAGILIPPQEPVILADTLLNLLSDQEQLLTMKKRGRDRYLKEYSFSAYKVKLDRILKQIENNLENNR